MTDTKQKVAPDVEVLIDATTHLTSLRVVEQRLKTLVMEDEANTPQFINAAYKLLPILRREIVKRSKGVTK